MRSQTNPSESPQPCAWIPIIRQLALSRLSAPCRARPRARGAGPACRRQAPPSTWAGENRIPAGSSPQRVASVAPSKPVDTGMSPTSASQPPPLESVPLGIPRKLRNK